MAAASALFRKKQNRAGLALHENDLKYIEIEGNISNIKVVNKLSLPSGGKGVNRNSLAEAGDLLAPLQALGSRIGGFKTPVALSLPSRDILLRVVELPELELDDAREALKWDFEKYFPYAYSDAAVDIAKVDSPLKGEPGTMSVLVAACKLRTVESIMRLADTAKIPLDTVEPENIAMFRSFIGPTMAFPTGYLAVFTDSAVSQLILGYRDNGILYRTSLVDIAPSAEADDGKLDYSPLVREIANTLTFARNQYRDLLVESIILGGAFAREEELKNVVSETSGLKVVTADPWGSWGIPAPKDDALNWETAVGLAVRGLS